MRNKYNLGFTLIELLVVISIVGVLSTVVMAYLSPARVNARDAARIAQIKEVQKALTMYYSNHGSYPSNSASLLFDSSIPQNWSSMVAELEAENLIDATFSLKLDNEKKSFSLVEKAYASVGGPSYYKCSIQDMLYKEAEDYPYSYGYVASADAQSYKIRIRLENANNKILNTSLTGVFLDTETTGDTACDKNLRYHCVGN